MTQENRMILWGGYRPVYHNKYKLGLEKNGTSVITVYGRADLILQEAEVRGCALYIVNELIQKGGHCAIDFKSLATDYSGIARELSNHLIRRGPVIAFLTTRDAKTDSDDVQLYQRAGAAVFCNGSNSGNVSAFVSLVQQYLR
jgi:DNA-binding LacI/PurR family transcriptional regulator